MSVTDIPVSEAMVREHAGIVRFAEAYRLCDATGGYRFNVRLVGTIGSAVPDPSNWLSPWCVTYANGENTIAASAYDAARKVLGMPLGPLSEGWNG
jgi:hypothetical protein